MDVRILLVFAGLLSVSMAQCTGSLWNETDRVSVSWNVIGNNTVQFIFSTPLESEQYTVLGFSRGKAGFTFETLDELVSQYITL